MRSFNLLYIIGFFLVITKSFAELSFDKVQDQEKLQVLESTKKALIGSDISSVNTRIKVEGASIRPFYLYFPAMPVNGSLIEKKVAQELRSIVDRDLAITGGFQLVSHTGPGDNDLLKRKGAEGISKLIFSIKNDVVLAAVENINLITNQIVKKNFSRPHKDKRQLAHQIARNIFETFIGPENIFSLQIAAVKREGINSQIVLMDFDGGNETPISQGSWSKSCPSFSPDGKTVLYGVVSPEMRGIVEQEIGKSNYYFRTRKPGLNLDPRIMPDNSAMLATLSFENNAQVYKLSRNGNIIAKLTSGLGLNLSPTISPDGKEFAFVSERSVTPQIYVQKIEANARADRLTLHGKYNQTPHFSPDGSLVAFTGMDENKVFDIFILDISDRKITHLSRVTQNQGRNQEPYFSPSGRFIIFTSERDHKPKADIFITTLNGTHQYRITNANNEAKTTGYYSPVIRPMKN